MYYSIFFQQIYISINCYLILTINFHEPQIKNTLIIMQKQRNKKITKTKSLHSEDEVKLNKTIFIDCKKQNINDFYDIQHILGEGGFGTVYSATLKTNRFYKRAIKSIQKIKLKKLRALENQIQILKKADHPSIIKIYQTYEDDKFIHIVMDICEGGELFYYLCENPNISQHIIMILFKQMVQAIQYCHHKNIAHRDIKPQNFLILSKCKNAQDAKLKLIDFGFAYQWNQSMKTQILEKKQSQAVGTPYYVAPQVLKTKEGYDQRCDIWSLGIILYIMVTGTPPFNGETDLDILKAVKRGKYSLDIPEMRHVSFTLKDLISKLLQPVQKRISLQNIFKHPWFLKTSVPTNTMKVNFGKMYNFAKYNKLKQIAVTYIASQMSEKQIIHLSELFQKIDSNHDGQLTIEEFQRCLEQQKNKISLKQIKNLIIGIDLDKDGRINYTEFVSSCLENLKIFKRENMINAFRMLDIDQNGKVSAEQLRYLLDKNQQLNEQIDEEQLQKIIKMSDKNKDGMLDYEEFQRALTGRI